MTTTLRESIDNEYSNLAEDTGGFIFFYDQDNTLQHIRYASDLPRAVSLCRQKSNIPKRLGYQYDDNGKVLREYSYGKNDSCGENRYWRYHQDTVYEFNQWCDTEKRWYKNLFNEVAYIKVYPYQNNCHTGRKWLNTSEYQGIKKECYKRNLPPVMALEERRKERELKKKESMISEYQAQCLKARIEQLQNEVERLSQDLVT